MDTLLLVGCERLDKAKDITGRLREGLHLWLWVLSRPRPRNYYISVKFSCPWCWTFCVRQRSHGSVLFVAFLWTSFQAVNGCTIRSSWGWRSLFKALPIAAEPHWGTFDSQLPEIVRVWCSSPFALVYSCLLVATYAADQTPGGPGSTGMDSWLDDSDIDKNFGPDLPLRTK